MKAAGCDFVVLGTVIRETIGTIAESRAKRSALPHLPGHHRGLTPIWSTSWAARAMDGLYATMAVQVRISGQASQPIRFWANKYQTKFSGDPACSRSTAVKSWTTSSRARNMPERQPEHRQLHQGHGQRGVQPDMFGSDIMGFSATNRLGTGSLAPVADPGRPLEVVSGLPQVNQAGRPRTRPPSGGLLLNGELGSPV